MAGAFLLAFGLLLSMMMAASTGQSLPFIVIVNVNPAEPQIFDNVGIPVQVHVAPTINMTELYWEFGDGANQSALLVDYPESFEAVAYHIYTFPGDYWVRVSLRDSQNRTAQDVYQLTVLPRGTEILVNVYPSLLNTTQTEHFTITAELRTNMGTPIAAGALIFWYSLDVGESWYPLAANPIQTGGDGRIGLTFIPPVDGGYMFKVSFSGSSLYAPSDGVSSGLACPEFPLPIAVLVVSMLCVVARRRRLEFSS